MSRALLFLTALGVLAGCQGSVKDVNLTEFKSCNQFENYMRRMAKREIAWDWGGGGIVRVGVNETMMAAEDSAAGMGEPGGIGMPGGGASSYSTTNLQEEGVDEDDLMKTDGSYIYALAGDSLVISRAWPLESAGQVSAINIDGQPRGLYHLGATIVVLSDLWWAPPNPVSDAGTTWREETQATAVTVVDISSLSEPKIVRETYFTGAFKESRVLDGTLFVVTYEDVRPEGWGSRAEMLRSVNNAELADYQSLRFDNIKSGDSWQNVTEPACGCTDIYASDQQGGTFVTTVSALDLDDLEGAWTASAVVGAAEVTYASRKSLYLGYSVFADTAFTGRTVPQDTVLHKFDISGGAPEYRATAQIPGYLNDQFSLSERDDTLFVAVTSSELTNGIVALEEDNGSFRSLGAVEGLAPGEEIFAARFLGDLAYLVTYEAILGDPLFTVDITDPSAMRATGELAVTGFSNYLHPLDEDHLLSVGMDDAGGFSDWRLAISLFDVSDLENPQLEDRILLDAWGSEAQTEHHAFNYFAPTQSLSVPSWASQGSSVLEVVHADADGLESLGRINQRNIENSDESWCTPIRRSVVMEDTIWALSAAGMTAATVDNPSQTVATVAYEGVSPCQDTYYWDERF